MNWRRTTSAVLFLLLAGRAGAADGPGPKTPADQNKRLEAMKQQAREYEAILDTSLPTKLVPHADPLLRFDNAVGGVADGVVFMWKEGERPAVFAQLFQLNDGMWIHEFQSLASAGVTMKSGGVIRWNPAAAAADFRPLPDGPRAAPNEVGRLVQLKAQASRFTATEDFRDRASDKDTNRYTLRLLAAPVYRYKDARHRVNDAAVFAFVHGTDPEVFLVLEHRGEGANAGWYYALSSMTCWAVQVKLADTEVWKVAERLGKTVFRDPYHQRVYRPGQ